MKVTTSKSKNAESFYISKSFINDKGVSTSVNVRKLGTLADLLKKHGPGSLTATDSLYKPQTLIKTGFQSYFFVNLLSILCSYL